LQRARPLWGSSLANFGKGRKELSRITFGIPNPRAWDEAGGSSDGAPAGAGCALAVVEGKVQAT
jgi:hypothetical protein